MRIPIQIDSKGETLLGVFHIAKKQLKIPQIIIMCYGRNGTRVEEHRMSVKIADNCGEHGINFLRFDFAGVGVSEGDFFNSTIANRMENLDDIISFVKGCFYSPVNIYLIGFCDGAKLAIKYYKTYNDIAGVILWNPLLKVPGLIKTSVDSWENNNKFGIHPVTKRPYIRFSGLYMNIAMQREINNEQTATLIEETDSILSIFAEDDLLSKDFEQYLSHNFGHCRDISIIKIQNAGHLFIHSNCEMEVIHKTINWLIQKQFYLR